MAAAILAVAPVPSRADEGLTAGLHKEIDGLTKEMKQKKNEMEDLDRKAERYRRIIMEKKMESASIEDQIALLENRIAKTQLDIEIAKGDIRRLELETRIIDAKIVEQEARMAKEREMLGRLARKLYRIQYRRSVFDILVTRSTFSEFFGALQQISELQTGVRKTLAAVGEIRASLEAERKNREAKQLVIADRKRELDVAKRELEDERALKEAILIETKASELEYRYLLAELKREQSEADSEISYLEKALREKMNLADRLGSENAVLSWPLVPAKGLSTVFHDPEYPFRYVFEHPGIDIRSAQGTPVRAAAAGIVARAKDAGMGYSYVMLIHNNDVSTVYGHLSRITSREDTFVERGEIIGYSGGMPGTSGAGRLTTGPHLHFETRLNGIPVDPMRFLISL